MHDAVLKAAFEADRARVQSHMASSSTDLTPIQKLHALLDDTVAATPSRWARHGPLGLNGSLKLRFGSVAADAEQVNDYSRLAASLGARNVSVCEIGFNAGHSAAVWLTSNPHLTLHTFDIFGKNDRAKRRCLELLQKRFPNRIVAHAGDSLVTVPAATVSPPCAIVHVDGMHSYLNVIGDAIQLSRHAEPDARFVFDDQCALSACDARSITPVEPTIATCDLARSGLLELVSTTRSASGRGWSVYRAGAALASRAVRSLPNVDGDVFKRFQLPCSRPCQIVLNAKDAVSRAVQTEWSRPQGESTRSYRDRVALTQRRLRPPGCL